MFEFLRTKIFGARLPQDLSTRIPRSVRKACKDDAQRVQDVIHQLAALPELAETRERRTVPKGFYALTSEYYRSVDKYIKSVSQGMGLSEAVRPGTPEGASACLSAPTTGSSIELLAIARRIRSWPNFATVGQRLLELAQAQMEDIQAANTGKDPAKPSLRASQNGRMAFAKRGEVCPFLDPETKRCRVWEQRPMSCRIQHITSNPEFADVRHEHAAQLKQSNLRLPVAQQMSLLNHLDRRLNLEISPIMYAGVLQVIEHGKGLALPEAGEMPPKLQPDGTFAQKANRNVAHSKKNQKNKRKK